MKSVIVGVLALSIFIFLGYKVLQFIDRIENSDPDYNTVYTKHFNETLFTNDLIGKTEKGIIATLGEPFSKTKLNYFNAIIYTNYKDSVYLSPNSNSVGIRGLETGLKYRFLSFDKWGNVKVVMIKDYPELEDSLSKLKKSKILELFGYPEKEILCDCNCDVYSYSKIREDGYSGKRPIINLRNIVFDSNGIAIRMVRAVGHAFSKYDSVCTGE